MRTTAEAVKLIIDVDGTINTGNIAPFIEAANALVTEICVPWGYDDTRLELIERWLSAHFYAIRDPRVDSEAAGPVNARYQGTTGLGLNVTTYGQQVMRLDTKGGLSTLDKAATEGKRRTIGITYLGTDCRRY